MNEIATLDTALTRYSAARHALEEAVRVDEVKDIRDKALAMAAYAKQAGDNSLIQLATEIRVRAERKAGQMLAQMPKATGAKGVGPIAVVVNDRNHSPTLKDLGISKDQSSRWQKLAAVPDDKFEQAVAAAKEVAGEVRAKAILDPKPAKPKPTPKPTPDEGAPVESKDEIIQNLRAELATMAETLAQVSAELDAYKIAQDGEAAKKEIMILQRKLELSNQARDQYMTTCGELRKEVAALKRKLGK